MRVDLKKFLFIGSKKSQERFFTRAQELGVIDFIDTKQLRLLESSDVRQTVKALKILNTFPEQEALEGVDPELAIKKRNQILFLAKKSESLEHAHACVQNTLEEVAPFQCFAPEKLSYLRSHTNLHIQLFKAKRGVIHTFTTPAFLIHSCDRFEYIASFSTTLIQSPHLVEVSITESLDTLKAQEKNLEHQRKEYREKLEQLVPYKSAIHELLIDLLNQDHLAHCHQKVDYTCQDALFAVSGFIPIHQIDAVMELAKQLAIFTQPVALNPEDRLPTYLENQGVGRIGQDLVEVYDTPASEDKDPSLWVLSFFALFYAIIVADAGYGLVFLLISGVLWWKFPDLKSYAKRALQLFTLLSLTSIGWGILSNSYFGMQVSPESPLRSVSLTHHLAKAKIAYHFENKDEAYLEWVAKHPSLEKAKTPEEFLTTAVVTDQKTSFPPLEQATSAVLLELSLFIGSLHLILSMLRYCLRYYPLMGWALFMVGAYLYIPAVFQYSSLIFYVFPLTPSIASLLGLELLIFGFAFAILSAIYQQGIAGIAEVVTVVQLLSDTLSYLRLYALGLAGGILAQTINELAAPIPPLLAVIVMLIAHSVNMLLCIMGGVIHGLRLNFLEWYHYSFEGGGRPFNPLRILTKDD